MMIFSGDGGGGHFYLPREAASGTRVSNFGRCSHPLSISFFEFLPSHSPPALRRRAYQNDTKTTQNQNQNRRKAKSKEQQTTNNQHKTQGTIFDTEPRGARSSALIRLNVQKEKTITTREKKKAKTDNKI